MRKSSALRGLGVEGLEPRTLLAVTPSLSGSTATFSGLPGDDLYLKTEAGLLAWSADGTSYSTDLGGGATLNLTAQASTIVASIVTAHLAALDSGGQDLSIHGSKVEDVDVLGPVDTQGGDLAITDFARATVGSATGGATISTRNLGGSTAYTTAPSQGDSGSLTITVQNVDPFNPILNVDFQYPQITIGAGSALLAQTDGGHAAGAITLHATNINYTLDGLSFPTLEAAVRAAAITLADGAPGGGAVIQGGAIDIEATSGDVPVVSSLISGRGAHADDEFMSWGQWVSGFLNGALQVVNTLPVLNAFNLPLSVDFRDAHTAVTIGRNALVRGSGDVNIQASSTADAEGTAIYARNSQGGAAIALMVGITDARAEVKESALVGSSGGDIAIGATSNTTTTGMARVSQNFDPKATSSDHIHVSLTIGVIDETAHATIDAGATIQAAGNVAVAADGTSANTGMPASSSYSDGKAGGAFAINATVNDIEAQVSGTVIAGAIDDGTTATSVAPSLTFNPFTDIDFASGGIRVPAAEAPRYKTGQEVIYTTGGGGTIGGLRPGATYYVIAPTGGSNEIRLAATRADALTGKAIAFDVYPTLSSGAETVPITLLDETTGTIQFGFDPGFTDGAALTYRAVPDKLIGGLVDGATYYAIVDPASPYTLQLSATPPSGGTDGPALPLNLNPVFLGARQALPVTVNPSGAPANSITFGFETGFRLGDFFVYQGTGIGGLTGGVTYWAIPDASDPRTIRLAATLADAQAGQALRIGANVPGGSNGGVLTFDPAYSLDSTSDTIDLGFNVAPAGTLPSGTPLVYHGALGTSVAGLVEGATYYVILDPADPRSMRLTATNAATAQAAHAAAEDAYNQNYNQAYDAWLAEHPGDTQGATQAANLAAALSGTAWTAEAFNNARVGTAPPVGTFGVTVDPVANTLDFGFDAGFVRNKPLVYVGPSSTSPGINGLVPGGSYYVRLPDRVNHPGRVQLADAAGNIIPISLNSGTTTTIPLDELTTGNVSVAGDALRFNTPGDPSTPFDPGLNAGDPFAYDGPATASDPGIDGLTPGTIYYVILTATAGVIQLAASPADAQAGQALTISLSAGSTNIDYGVPFVPKDLRPSVVTALGGINNSSMSGVAQALTGSGVAGITISATLSDSESDFASSGTEGSPGLQDRLLRPEVTSPTIKDWFTQLWQQPQAPNSNNPIASAAPNNAIANGLPGGNGTSPSWSLAGTFVVQVAVNSVAADVTGTAVLESASDLSISASVTQSSDTSAQGSVSRDQDSDGRYVALAIAFGFADQTISATIDDGAQVDAAGTISVTAETVYPFEVPTTTSAWEEDLVYNPVNSTYNPLATLVNFLTDSMFGLGTDILNNSASAKVSAAGADSVGVSGTIQLFIAVNHTTASIGNALINQKTSDPDALGPGVGITFRNPAQAVSVTATTQYNNASETGAFDFNLAPADFIKNWRSKGIKTAFGSVFNLYGDASAGKALGASISIYALDNTTVAEIATGAKVGIGSAGTLDVKADQQIIAVALVQSGAAAGGNIGFAGSVNWNNLTSTTRSQIHDGVTVDHPVDSPVIAVNAGGEADGGYQADSGFDGGQVAPATPQAIDTSQVENPAPQVVYQTNRYGNDFRYVLTGLTPNVAYRVRLDFAETYWQDPGQRIFNVAINGQEVLSRFDILASAGGEFIALERSFTVLADGNGVITIHFTTEVDNAQVNGITITPVSAAEVRVVADDTMYVVGVTGGAVKSDHIGVGFSASVNNIDRTTQALIGSTQTPSQPGSFTVGSLHVGATADGLVATVAYAAASISPAQGTPPVGAGNPLNGLALPNAQFGNNNPLQQQQNGIATSGDASVNVLRSDTEAFINDAGTFNVQGGAGQLTIDPGLQQATTIHFDQAHGLATGDPLVYTAAAAIGGLTSGATYYAIRIDPYTIALAASAADVLDGKPIALNASGASGTQTLTPTSGAALAFDPSAVGQRVLSFAAPHGLATGEAVQYTSGSPIGGLTSGATYYAIVVDDERIELADSYADARAGKALALDVTAGSGTQTLAPVALTVNAASQAIVVGVAGAYANSAVTTGSGSNLGIAGSLSANVIDDTTKAFLDGATITAGQLGVTADHAGYIGSLTAGAAGASGQQGTAVAGSVSVNLGLTDTEATIDGATITLAGDSNLKAREETQIWAIAGAGAFGGKGGYDVSIAVNLIGFSNQLDLVPNKPAQSVASITNSTITLESGTLSVNASDGGVTALPRIVSLTDSLGIGTQPSSYAGAGMVAVNIIVDQTRAFLQGSRVVQASGSPGAAVVVGASDTSWILAVGGAEGGAQKVGLGAAIGYNQIDNTTSGYLDSTEIDVNGPVTISAHDAATITGGTLGVGVSIGQGGFAGAGSASVNLIGNTTDAHVANGSNITAAGPVTVQAGDASLIVAVAGAVAGANKAAVGAAVGYNKIGNTITASIDDSTIHTTGAPGSSGLTVAAESSAELIAVVVGGAGASSFALGGSIAINEVANTVEADVVDGSTLTVAGDVVIDAGDTTTLIVVAGAAAGAQSAAVGAAVGTAQVENTIKAHIDGSTVNSTGGAVGVTAGFQPPDTPTDRSSVSLGTTTVVLPTMSNAQVVNVAVAGAGAETFAGGAAIALNWIKNDVEASIVSTAGSGNGPATRSVVTAQGDVTVAALDSTEIDSAAAGFGGAGTAAVGAAVSYNYIGGDPGNPSRRIPPADGPATYTTAAAVPAAVQPGDTVDVVSGFTGQGTVGSRYQYAGSSVLTVSNWNAVSFDDASNWTKLDYSDTPGQVLAFVDESNVTSSAGSVHVDASSHPEIVNVTVGGAGAGTLAVDGSISINFMRNIVHAAIQGGAAVTGQVDLGIQATAQPTMIIVAGAGGGAGTLAASVASATNDMRSDIQAFVDGSTVAATTGDLTIHAAVERASDLPEVIPPATYTTSGTSGTVTVQPGDTVDVEAGFAGMGTVGGRYQYIGADPLTVTVWNSVNFKDKGQWQGVTNEEPDSQIWAFAVSGSVAGTASVAGSVASNWVRNTLEAKITNIDALGTPGGEVQTGGTLSVTTQDDATINAVAGALTGAGTGSFGASLAYNYIGGDPNDPTSTTNNTVRAAIEDVAGRVRANQIVLDARSTGEIHTITIGGAGAENFALGGAVAINQIRTTVDAHVANAADVATVGAGTPNIGITAIDDATIKALAGGLGFTLSLDDAPSGAIGASAAWNKITNTITANIDSSQVVSAGGIAVSASSTGMIEVLTIGGAGATVAGDGFAASGAGSGSGNMLDNAITSTITDTLMTGRGVSSSGGDVALAATDSPDIEAAAGAIALVVDVGDWAGAGISVGISVAINEIQNTVAASIEGATVHADGHDVTLTATDAATLRARSIGSSLGLAGGSFGGLAISGAGAGASNTISNTVQATVSDGGSVTTTGGGAVRLSAHDSAAITSDAGGFAIAASGSIGSFTLTIGISIAFNTITNTVQATVDDSTVSTAGGDVQLSAVEDATIDALTIGGAVAVSGGSGGNVSAAGAGAIGFNTIADTVQATLSGGGALTTNGGGDVSLSAADTATINAKSVGGAIAISGSGGGAGAIAIAVVVAKTEIGNTVGAASSGATISAAGGLGLSATSNATITALSVAASVTFSGGAEAGSFSFSGAGADSTSTVDNNVSASIQGASASAPSTITAAGPITLLASETSTFDAEVGSGALSFAVAGAAIDLSLASNSGRSTVNATIDNAHVTSTGGRIALGALADPTAQKTLSVATSVAAAIGGAGAAAQASATFTPTVEAVVGSRAVLQAAQDVAVKATLNGDAEATTANVAVGEFAVGVSVTQATAGGSAQAHVDGVIVGSTAVAIGAIATQTAAASATGAAGGLNAAGDAAAATANVGPTVQAYTGNGARITATNAVSVGASVTPHADATAFGVDVAVDGALGVSVAIAGTDASVDASVGDNTSVTAGSLAVTAQQAPVDANTPTAHAKATTGTGGVLVGVQATVAKATAGGEVNAYTGTSIALPDGDVLVSAMNQTWQKAEALGVSVGLALGVGANVVEADSAVTTTATLGTSPTTSAQRTGDLTVQATGIDRNEASSTAGSGGLVAGNASVSTISDSSTVAASLGAGTIHAGAVNVNANHDSQYAPYADSINAAVVGASGANARYSGNTTATVDIAPNVQIAASDTVRLAAQNQLHQTSSGDTVKAGGGGVLNGTAAISQASFDGTSSVSVGSGVVISSGTDPFSNPGGIVAVASSLLEVADQVTLTTGGAIEGAGANSKLDATLNNSVEIGAGAQLTSQGNIGVGTYAVATAENVGEVHTYGLAGVGVAEATSNLTANQTVTLDAGAALNAFGDVVLTPGNDPTGAFSTIGAGTALAEAYVRGLIAVPKAEADSDVVSNATLSVAPGVQVASGLDVTIGAFPGTAAPMADGTGHGYEIGFIPMTKHDSSPHSTTSAALSMDGTISAGIYHNLDITIPNSMDSGVYSSQVNVAPGGAPFTHDFNPSFNPPDFIAHNFTGTAQQILDNTTSSTNVGEMMLGPLFAAGGIVTVHADLIQGSGSITAYGGPTITVTNNSPDYLRLRTLTIPDAPGGDVLFTGAAKATQAGGVAVNQVNAGQDPVITITNAYTGPVGNSSYGPALFLLGTIENLGGLVQVTNQTGSLGQLAQVFGAEVVYDVPEGAVSINIPPPGVYYPGGNPYSDWQGFMIWPGGNPAQVGLPDASQAIAWVANAEHNSDGSIRTADDLTRKIIGVAGARPPDNNSTVYIGYGVPYGDGLSGDSEDQAKAWSQMISGDPHAGSYVIGSGTDGRGHLPLIPYQALMTVQNVYPTDGSGRLGSAIYGGQVSITAETIDLNDEITAGQPTDWSVHLDASLTPLLENYRQEYQNGTVTNPIYPIQVTTVHAGDSPITAQFDARTNQITVANVLASSGGGFVALNGQVISSKPLGHIHVTGGLGQVTVQNDTGLTVVIQDINAGSAALNGQADSRVVITDTEQPAATQQTLYVYQPGQGISVYQGPAGAVLGGGTPVTTIDGNSTTYNPVEGLRWGWVQQASLSRPINYDGSNPSSWSIGDWTWDAPVENNPWKYVDFENNNTLTTTPVGQVFTDPGLPIFHQLIQTVSSVGFTWDITYHDGHFGFWDNNGKSDWFYHFPSDAQITMLSSVKADNPVGIDFSGVARGSVSIVSNAPVILAGRLTNPDGDTTINAQGDISVTSGAPLATNDLTLNATGGIGDGTQPLAAALTSGGVLNAQAGAAGIKLVLDSGALVGSVVAGSAQGGYGDVSLVADGSLTPAAGQDSVPVNVTGNNLTIASNLGSVGAAAANLVLATPGASLAVGTAQGGVVNVEALGNIGIAHQGGDLFVGTIASRGGGDVSVAAQDGRMLDAHELTSTQTLDPDKARQIWQNLSLTDDYGARQEAQRSIAAFENHVAARYRQYWQLVRNGSVLDGTFALNADAVQLYRPQAAAALGIADPTDAQVQGYAANLYQSLVAFFIATDGASWAGLPEFQAFVSNYQYNAGAAQAAALSQNVSWTEAQLTSAVDRDGLTPDSGGPTHSTVPNVAGANVTLMAVQGIGRTATALQISLADLQAGNLTADQTTALMLATTPGDVLMVGVDGQGHTVIFPFGQQPAGVTPTGVQVARTAPLFVSANVGVTATAQGTIHLQAAEQDLNVASVQATGDVSLTAPGSILGKTGSSLHVGTPGALTLEAAAGTIGSGPGTPLMLQLGGTLANALAGSSAYLEQMQGDLVVGQIVAGADVWLQAAGSILGSGVDVPNITARNVTLTARGGIGTAQDDLTINTTAEDGGDLTASAATGLYLNELDGDLVVDQASTSQGDLRLTVTDGSLRVGPGNTIGAAAGHIALHASADLTIAARSQVAAGQGVTIAVGGPAPGAGSRIDVQSAIAAPSITISGGADDDALNLWATAAGSIMAVDLGGGANRFNVGSTQPAGGGVVAGIQGSLALDGHGADTLNIDDSGDNAALSGTLAASILTGMGMGSGGIAFGGMSALNVRLGAGGATLNVLSTSGATTTTIQSTPGQSTTINVGSLAPANGGIVDDIAGPLVVVGSGAATTLNLDDTGSTGAESGTLTASALTGLGLGSSGIAYGGLAALNIGLGPGGNTFLIDGTASATATALDTGTGADTINVRVTGGSIAVNTGGGSNTNLVHVGRPVTGFSGNETRGIQGALTVVGNGADTLNVDDSGGLTNEDSTLTATTLTGLGMGPGGITFSGITTLDILLSKNGASGTHTIQGTPAGATTRFDASNAASLSQTVSFDVGSQSPGLGGNLAGILGALVLVATPGGNVALNIDNSGDDTLLQTGTLTESTLTGLGMGTAGITYSGIATLDILLGTGGNALAVGVSIGADLPGTTRIDLGPSIVDGVAAVWAGDLNGSLTLLGSEASALEVGGNVNGTFATSQPGNITQMAVAGSLSAPASVVAGNIGFLTILGDLTGSVRASGLIEEVTVYGTVQSTAAIEASNATNPALGVIGSITVGPDAPAAGHDMAGQVIVSGKLGDLRVSGGTPGTINAGSVGTVRAYSASGEVLMQIEEAGVQRRVELWGPNSGWRPTPPPDGLDVRFIYEGSASSTSPASPQWSGRVTNANPPAPNQFDLRLITWSDLAKFNLSRLDTPALNPSSGIRNVTVEGDLLAAVTLPASQFLAGDSTLVTPLAAGVQLPADDLAAATVRDNAQAAGLVRARSIQGLAFGSLTVGGTTRTGQASSGAFAVQLLDPSTRLAQAGAAQPSNQLETFLVPFAAAPGQAVALFLRDGPSPVLDGSSIAFTDQGQGLGDLRGSVTALVYVFGPGPFSSNSGIDTISLAGDGGSIATDHSVVSGLISSGPVGDLTFGSPQGITGLLVAPSFLGNIVATAGPITGRIETTGLRVDVTTGQESIIPADLGRVLTDDGGTIIGTTVITSAGPITGQHIVSRGNLVSRVQANGGISAVIAAQGDLGAIQRNPDGTARLDGTGQLARFGGVDAGGPFTGQLVVLGNVFGDLTMRDQGAHAFRAMVKGQPVAGLDPARLGMLGEITIHGTIAENPPDGLIVEDSALASAGLIGDAAGGTSLNAAAISGILAAKGAIHLGQTGPVNASTFFPNAGTPGNPNGAVIAALFEKNGQPLSFDLDPSNQDLLGLADLLSNLAALHVGSDGNLALGTGATLNRAPIVGPLPDHAVAEGTALVFVIPATDPDLGQRLTFQLEPGAPEGAQIHPNTGRFTWTPTGPASVTVTVRITDSGSPPRSVLRSFRITASPVDPTVNLAPAVTALAGLPVAIAGSFTDPGAVSWTATVDYGDGAGPQPLALGPDKSLILSHTYAEAGTYTVTVRVSDSTGTGVANAVVTVLPPRVDLPPPVRISGLQLAYRRGRVVAVRLSLTGAIVPAAARDLSNFRLMRPGRDRKLGTRDDRPIRLKFAAYDPVALTISLAPRGRIARSSLRHRLLVDGSRLLDSRGRALDGDGDGRPGGTFAADLTRKGARTVPVRIPSLSAQAVDAVLEVGVVLESPRRLPRLPALNSAFANRAASRGGL